jgi:hypothetical protein
MKITDVSSILLEPWPWVLMRVRTDKGITGIEMAL